jgi:hypothetical protein
MNPDMLSEVVLPLACGLIFLVLMSTAWLAISELAKGPFPGLMLVLNFGPRTRLGSQQVDSRLDELRCLRIPHPDHLEAGFPALMFNPEKVA